MKIYSCTDLSQEQRNTFSNVEWTEDIYQADIILGNPQVEDVAPKFIQLDSAGYENYTNKYDCPICNASGSFGLGISEYLICTILMSMRHMKAHMHNQDKAYWNRFDDTVSSIYGSTILILGVGNLGKTFAKKVRALGAYTIGLRKSEKPCEEVDEVYTINQLESLLPRADIIVSCLPSNEDTRYLLNESHFSKMKDSAIFVNVGRGDLVKLSILEDVMKKQMIQAMILDVVENEPLNKESSLWNNPNVIITPHISGTFQLEKAKEIFLDIARKNVSAFINNQPLLNLIK